MDIKAKIWELDSTPAWNCLISHQTPNQDFFEVMVGRLHYPVGKYDNWQVSLSILGPAETGKSCAVNTITRTFPPGSTASIGREGTFGAGPILDKRLLVFPEMSDMHSKICQTDFQSMVTGDRMTVPRKYKGPVEIDSWQIPVLTAGNKLPAYKVTYFIF
jgi:phage/plasmid-associated DNA primase